MPPQRKTKTGTAKPAPKTKDRSKTIDLGEAAKKDKKKTRAKTDGAKELSKSQDVDKEGQATLAEDRTLSNSTAPLQKPARPLLAALKTDGHKESAVDAPVEHENARAPPTPVAAARSSHASEKKTSREPIFSFCFRFINYNMANSPDVQMDDIGNGFTSRNPASATTTRISFTQLLQVGTEEPVVEDGMQERSRPSSQSQLNRMGTMATLSKLSAGLMAATASFMSARSTNSTHSTRSKVNANVDFCFSVLSESKASLEELEKLQSNVAYQILTTSALQSLSEVGFFADMKGKVANKFSGDLKATVLCRSRFEELDDGRIYCSFDEASKESMKGNPMKSFLGRTFDVACGALRLVFLGAHFPMTTISRLMEDTARCEDDVFQEMKYLMARCLQKIIRHLLERNLMNNGTMVVLQGDLNSRSVRHNGSFVDLLFMTLQDGRLQHFISADLPVELQGEWREVVSVDPESLPVTYRFATAGTFAEQTMTLRQVYGAPNEDEQRTYRDVFEKLKGDGSFEAWGLYNHGLDADGSKFKPSRLPAATERVLYYAPRAMLDRAYWETTTGYVVNNLQSGSDHKPVMLEAKLHVGSHPQPQAIGSCESLYQHFGRNSCVPEDFEQRFCNLEKTAAAGQDDSDDSDCDRTPRRARETTRQSFMPFNTWAPGKQAKSHVKEASRRGGLRFSFAGKNGLL